uniref:protein acetyllysine N-acetyltransferase n=3 Tax=Schistocephalus solidus TaxID=70667 RepID=A0A0X3P8T1_SCHSO
MSVNYASGLSPYANKGVCGLPELCDSEETLSRKITSLVDLLRTSKYTVVHTGAGISTPSGIPDFRGPKGVWTLEKQGKSPETSVSFEEALPSTGHMALVALERAGFINYLITQNIDGLHLRSGFPINRMSILHGDMFLESCDLCNSIYVRASSPVPTMGRHFTGFKCTRVKAQGRPCRGKLRDTILDWEDELPYPDYSLAVRESRKACLHVCLGTSLQIFPAAGLPFQSTSRCSRKRKRSPDATTGNCKCEEILKADDPLQAPKVVIVNLQPTKMDSRATFCLHAPIDRVLSEVCAKLNVPVPTLMKPSQKFEPNIVFRSRHSSQLESCPQHIFWHPANEQSPLITSASALPLRPKDELKYHEDP